MMASDWVLVGGDGEVRVHRHREDGTASVTLLRADPPRSLYIPAALVGTVAELLDRAAVPGQPAEPPAPVHLPSGGERVESVAHRLLGLPEGF